MSVDQFTLGCLEAWGAQKEQIAPSLLKVCLPGGRDGIAARYLDRPAGEILLNCGQSRWEQGSRVEPLSLAAPLVRRLMSVAESRGQVTTVTSFSLADHPEYRMQLYCRFSSRIVTQDVFENRQWMGIDMNSGDPLPVCFVSPLEVQHVCPGRPDHNAKIKKPRVNELTAIETLVQAWEMRVNARAAEVQADATRRFTAEAQLLIDVLPEPQRGFHLRNLIRRYAITVEPRLEAIVRLWMAD